MLTSFKRLFINRSAEDKPQLFVSGVDAALYRSLTA
jgi:hypothetical protein